MTRILICGGRYFTDFQFLSETLSRELAEFLPDVEIVQGNAPGADLLGALWGRRNKLKVTAFPADWDAHPRAAGPLRNQAMLDYGVDLVVAMPGGTGTRDMIARATHAGVEVRVIEMPDATVGEPETLCLPT